MSQEPREFVWLDTEYFEFQLVGPAGHKFLKNMKYHWYFYVGEL